MMACCCESWSGAGVAWNSNGQLGKRDLKTKIPQHLWCNRFGSRGARCEVDDQALYLPTRQRWTDLLLPFLRRWPDLHGSNALGGMPATPVYLPARAGSSKLLQSHNPTGQKAYQHEFLHHDEIGSLVEFGVLLHR